MIIEDNIRDVKLKDGINREAAKNICMIHLRPLKLIRMNILQANKY